MGGLIGLFLATVGIDDMSGTIRFTLDTTYLMGGVSFIPVLIGVFAFAQVLGSMAEQNFVGSLIMSDGSFGIFFERPLCLFFLVVAVLSLLSPVFGRLLKRS